MPPVTRRFGFKVQRLDVYPKPLLTLSIVEPFLYIPKVPSLLCIDQVFVLVPDDPELDASQSTIPDH